MDVRVFTSLCSWRTRRPVKRDCWNSLCRNIMDVFAASRVAPTLHDRHQSATASLAVGQRVRRGPAVGCWRDLKPELARGISSQPPMPTTPSSFSQVRISAYCCISRTGPKHATLRYGAPCRRRAILTLCRVRVQYCTYCPDASSSLRSALKQQKLHSHVPGRPLLSAGELELGYPAGPLSAIATLSSQCQ